MLLTSVKKPDIGCVIIKISLLIYPKPHKAFLNLPQKNYKVNSYAVESELKFMPNCTYSNRCTKKFTCSSNHVLTEVHYKFQNYNSSLPRYSIIKSRFGKFHSVINN